jgi:hypothetical protein
VVEIKFGDSFRSGQLEDYAKIAGGADKVVELSPQECLCKQPEPVPVLVPVPEKEKEPVPVPVEEPSLFGKLKNTISENTGLTGAALTAAAILYIVVSEGSRIFPPRNLAPIL